MASPSATLVLLLRAVERAADMTTTPLRIRGKTGRSPPSWPAS